MLILLLENSLTVVTFKIFFPIFFFIFANWAIVCKYVVHTCSYLHTFNMQENSFKVHTYIMNMRASAEEFFESILLLQIT